MAFELDQTSRATLARFGIKCSLSFVIALFAKSSFLFSASACLELFAILTALIAVCLRQRYSPTSFNHWSAALWLLFLASGLKLAFAAAS